MADYPTIDGDVDVWGPKLRTWNFVATNPDGTLKSAPTVVNPMADDYGAAGDGATNDTDAFEAAADDLATMGTLWVPFGRFRVDPLVFTRMFQIKGEGALASWLAPWSNLLATHLLGFDVSDPSPDGTNRGFYGASIEDIGLDLSAAPSAKGGLFGVGTGHADLKRVWVQGGAVSFENRGANNRVERCTFADAVVPVLVDGDTGLELRITDTTTARNSPGTTEHVLKVLCQDNTPNKGALRLTSFVHQSGTSGGVQTDAGWLFQSDHHTSMPVIADRCEIDNITGGGPGIDAVNVDDLSFTNGWINCGFAGPAARFEDVDFARFVASTLRGDGTFELVTWPGDSFVVDGCALPSNPIFIVPDIPPPVPSIYFRSHVVTPAPLDICNHPDRLVEALAPELGGRWHGDITRQGDVGEGFAVLKRGVATLVAGAAGPIAEALYDPVLTLVHVERAIANGALGHLYFTGASAGAFTLHSSSATDTSQVEWYLVRRY